MDRIIIREGLGTRLADSLETALRLADGVAQVEVVGRPRHALLGAPGLRRVRDLLSRGLAAHVLVQQSRTVPAPPAAASGRATRWIRRGWCRSEKRSLNQGALAPWAGQPGSVFKQTLQVLARRHKFSLDTPWGKLSKKARDIILHGEPGDGFEGVLKILDRRTRRPCPRTRGGEIEHFMTAPGLSGLPGLAPPAGGPRGEDRAPLHRRRGAAAHQDGGRVLRDAQAHRARGGHRAPGAEGSARAARISRRGGPRLPDAGPRRRHAVRRRGAADPPGHPDRLQPGGRPLHPGRAVHRPAPAGQPPAARHPQAAARPGQHGAGGRARRGDHPLARTSSWTWGPGRASTAATWWRVGTPDEIVSNPASLTGRFLAGTEQIAAAGRAPGDRGASSS